MKKLLIGSIVFLSIGMFAVMAFARGGGGCFEAGTPILTPRGAVVIESLTVGDEVWSVAAGQLRRAIVQARIKAAPAELLALTVAGRVLRVTGEHPFEVEPGVFRIAAELRVGDVLWIWDGNRLRASPVQAIAHVTPQRPAYNLLVSPGGTYLADGVVVHNKGCFLPDTPISKADGTAVPLRDVRPGDRVLAFTPAGQLVAAQVNQVLTHEVAEYLIVRTAQAILRVTPEHPFFVGNGVFKTLAALTVGDQIFAYDGQGLRAQRILSLERVQAQTRVYNLQTDAPNTFFANGLLVHNKGGGCFPAGVKIRTPQGLVAIEQLAPNDLVLAVDAQGSVTQTVVEAVHVTRAPLLLVETDDGAVLRTTTEHPLQLADGSFQMAGVLAAGQQVQRYQSGRLRLAAIRAVRALAEEVEVFNLSVGAPHTFLAEDFVAHNKGGGGFRSSSRGSSGGGSGDDWVVFLFLMVFGGLIVLISIAAYRSERAKAQAQEANLDMVHSLGEIAPKANKTMRLVKTLAQTDPAYAPEALKQTAESTFVQLQQCWQARDYAPLKPRLLPALYDQHCAQLESLRRNHEMNMIANLRVESVHLIHVRFPRAANDREFTALITASAEDYYVDDRTRQFLRGDKTAARFQEFWTFRQQDGVWRLREIEQTRESRKLTEANFCETLPTPAVNAIETEPAGQTEIAGTSSRTAGSRLDRLLDALARTDPLWDRRLMPERARGVFTQVCMARETGELPAALTNDLFPAIAEALRQELDRRQRQGVVTEFRNFCVRSAEIILVNNFEDNARDEFTARISAHAQRIGRKNGKIAYQDKDVTAFEEYWTFGRSDEQWKLKQMHPAARGQQLLAQESFDQDQTVL